MKHKKIEKSELEKRLEAAAAAEVAAEEQKRQQEAAPPKELEADEAEPVPLQGFDVNALLAERDQLKDLLLRSRAEFDNYRKRMARETERIRKTAAEAIIRDLLPLVDDLERAVEHVGDASGGLAQGVEMVLKQFCGLLSRHGVEPIPAVGEVFDPNVHEAVMRMPSAVYPANTVAQEFQRGYRLGDYVLRPAKAVVSSGMPEEECAEAVGKDVEAAVETNPKE